MNMVVSGVRSLWKPYPSQTRVAACMHRHLQRVGGFPKHPYIPPSFSHILCPPHIKAPSCPWGLTIPVQWLLFHMLTWGHKARGISRQQPVSDAQQYSSFILCQECFPFGDPKVAGLAMSFSGRYHVWGHVKRIILRNSLNLRYCCFHLLVPQSTCCSH